MWLLATLLPTVIVAQNTIGWMARSFPDIRGPSYIECGDHLPRNTGYMPYVCDPDKVFNRTEIARINSRLLRLAQHTPCKCQRRSQCMAEDQGIEYQLGFVVAVAIVKNLQMTIHKPSEEHLNNQTTSFCRALQGRWALGDCGNSVIVFIWQQYKKLYISTTDRLTSGYLTEREKQVILQHVQEYVNTDQWGTALLYILDNIQAELHGMPEEPWNTGFWSLLIAIGAAVVVVAIITGCVCAFRCCGNLRQSSATDSRSPVGRAVQRVDSLRAQVVRRGSQLRRSLSKSPKFPPRQPQSNYPQPVNAVGSPADPNQTRVLLGYYRDSDTTMV